jgi:hypothetical protein
VLITGNTIDYVEHRIASQLLVPKQYRAYEHCA